jgi:mono/diheme cytochrome c family protein
MNGFFTRNGLPRDARDGQRSRGIRGRFRPLLLLFPVLAMWCFARPESRAQNSAPAAKTAAAPAGNAQNGKKLFISFGCYECHGTVGQGARSAGMRIGPPPLDLEGLTDYVRAPAGEMPPYTAKVVSDQELSDIYAYLSSIPKPPPAKSIPLLN